MPGCYSPAQYLIISTAQVSKGMFQTLLIISDMQPRDAAQLQLQPQYFSATASVLLRCNECQQRGPAREGVAAHASAPPVIVLLIQVALLPVAGHDVGHQPGAQLHVQLPGQLLVLTFLLPVVVQGLEWGGQGLVAQGLEWGG